MSQSPTQAQPHAFAFFATFSSHIVTGEFEMGGLFEWAVVSDGPSENVHAIAKFIQIAEAE